MAGNANAIVHLEGNDGLLRSLAKSFVLYKDASWFVSEPGIVELSVKCTSPSLSVFLSEEDVLDTSGASRHRKTSIAALMEAARVNGSILWWKSADEIVSQGIAGGRLSDSRSIAKRDVEASEIEAIIDGAIDADDEWELFCRHCVDDIGITAPSRNEFEMARLFESGIELLDEKVLPIRM